MKAGTQILILALAVAGFLSACNKGVGGARVKGVVSKSGANLTNAKKSGDPTAQPTAAESAEKRKAYLDGLPANQRAEMKSTMLSMLSLKPMLRDAHEVFIQVWKTHLGRDEKLQIAGDAEAKESIFQLLLTTIEQNYQATGVPFSKEETAALSKKCQAQEIKTLGVVEGKENSFSFKVMNCSNIQTTPPIIATFQRTQNPIDASSPKVKKALWTINFEYAAIKTIASGAGSRPIDLYSTLFGKWMPTFYSESSENPESLVKCTMSALSNYRLESLNCQNLGQDLDKQAYIHYKTLKYANALESKVQTDAAKSVQVKGEIFKIKDDGTTVSATTELKSVNAENLVLTIVQNKAPEAERIVALKSESTSGADPQAAIAAQPAAEAPVGIEAVSQPQVQDPGSASPRGSQESPRESPRESEAAPKEEPAGAAPESASSVPSEAQT